MKVWVPPLKAKFGQWARYRLVLSFPFERLKYLKTTCFKHSYTDPIGRLILVANYQRDSFNNLDFWDRGTNTPPTPNMTGNKIGRYEHILFTAHDYNIFAPLSTKI